MQNEILRKFEQRSTEIRTAIKYHAPSFLRLQKIYFLIFLINSTPFLAKTRKSSAAGFSCPDQRRRRKKKENQCSVGSGGTSGSNEGAERENRRPWHGGTNLWHEGTRDPERSLYACSRVASPPKLPPTASGLFAR